MPAHKYHNQPIRPGQARRVMTTRISHSDLQDGSVEQDLLPHSQTGIYYYCYCWEVSALSLFVSPNSVISYYPICPASHYKPIRGILFTQRRAAPESGLDYRTIRHLAPPPESDQNFIAWGRAGGGWDYQDKTQFYLKYQMPDDGEAHRNFRTSN